MIRDDQGEAVLDIIESVVAKAKKKRSKQDVGTPREFLTAVEARFGPIVWDLACDSKNCVTGSGNGFRFDLGEDGLVEQWEHLGGRGDVLWLNPPFANIRPWVEKAGTYEGLATIAMLLPASIGTDWFAEHVHNKAYVLGLSPRMTFVGEKDPYPKDLMLLVYERRGWQRHGFGTWRWKP